MLKFLSKAIHRNVFQGEKLLSKSLDPKVTYVKILGRNERINSKLFFITREFTYARTRRSGNVVVNISSVRRAPSASANPIKSRIEEQSGISLYGHDRYLDFMERRAHRERPRKRVSYSKRVLYFARFADFFRYPPHANIAERKLRPRKVAEKRSYVSAASRILT